jgi:hypothetical protein
MINIFCRFIYQKINHACYNKLAGSYQTAAEKI